jgi:phosphatidylcholine synthase
MTVAEVNRAQPNRTVAWLVHLYTACGAVVALFAMLAISAERYREAFLWMIVATLIDATDGVLARYARVKEALPAVNGAKLDDIVDYLTFVFVPVLLVYDARLLPQSWGAAVASIVLLSSAYGFVASDAKTDDHFFTGFPSYWNVVALYLYAFGFPQLVNAVVLLLLSALVFVRVGYIYPSRTPALRRVTLALAISWGAMVIAMVLALPRPPRVLMWTSLLFPLYYTAASLALHVRRARTV